MYKNQLKNEPNTNVRLETLKPLQENIGKTLEDIAIGNALLNRTPIAQEIIARICQNGIASN
jgi:hypothetical protein